MRTGDDEAVIVETASFRVLGSCVEPRSRAEIDNSLTDAIVAELGPLGLIPDRDAFERLFIRIVEDSAPTPGLAWNCFYRNTLTGLRRPLQTSAGGSVVTFARIYAQVGRLALGASVLDIGSCFGFLPFLLAERLPGTVVIGSDVATATVRLARGVTRALGSRAIFLVADARRLPLADRAVSTVTIIHVLEHLTPEAGRRVVAEALRVADQRVVIAVPFEAVANPAYGHVRTFDRAGLAQLAAGTDWHASSWERDGGWLLLDRQV
jgi:SAM-dependent methyltransferase